MSDIVDAHAHSAAEALTLLRQYRGSDQTNVLIKMLSSLEEQYRQDLETVEATNLIQLQTALRQVSAIKRAIISDQPIDCKII